MALINAGAASGGFDRFHQNVLKSFIPLEFSCPRGAEDSVVSEFVTRDVGTLRLTEGRAFSAVPLRGQLRREQIADSSPDWFVLLTGQAGDARHLQFGRSDITTPGKMILIHACSPYQVQPEARMSALFINIPGALLRAAVGSPEQYCAITIDAGRGLNALFGEFLHLMWREYDAIDERQKDLLSRHFFELLVPTLESVKARAVAARPPSRDDQHFERASHFIDAYLADPSLRPAKVAQALRLSESRLHAIARNKGTSICQTILERRLKGCSRTLADAGSRHLGITQIAFDWGFRSSSYFSQVFRARFGVSPREYRKRHLPG